MSTTRPAGQTMSTFSEQFGDDVMGELTMFDRMVFKGHLSAFFPKGAFKAFLDKQGVLLKGFKDFVQRATADIAKHAEMVAERARRPFIRKAEQFTQRHLSQVWLEEARQSRSAHDLRQ